LYSVHSNLGVRQPDRPISELARGHAMPGETADGNDAETVWRLAGKAIERARSGGGPSLLEFMTYRWYEHCGTNPDTNLGYRSEAEFAEWQARCPVARSEARLRREGLLDDAALAAAEARIAAEIEDAVAFAKASPFPDPASLYEDLVPAS